MQNIGKENGNKYSGLRGEKKKKESKGFLCSKLAERSTRREMILSFLLHILGQPISRVVVLTGNSTFWEKEDQYIELTENLIILI